MTRPIRSLLIGDTDYYFSPYIHGVAQACGRLGIWHSQVSIRCDASLIMQRVRDVRPDLIWTHMLLWGPIGSCPRNDLLAICRAARRDGARVLLHDGDVKEPTRFPNDISDAVDLALCNHKHDRSAWCVPAIHWPYAAFPQDRIADPIPELRCDLAFAGQLGTDAVYSDRTRFVERLRGVPGLDFRVFAPEDGNTLLRTPEIAASATAVLGFGRPDQPGWVDTRVGQYAGAGAVLLHDDVQGLLESWEHYAPYESRDADSAVATIRLLQRSPRLVRGIRERAFAFGQEHHSYVARVRQVLETLGWGARAGR